MKIGLYYKDEHTNCFLYESLTEPVISHVSKKKGEYYEVNDRHSRIFFLLKGRVRFMFGHVSTVLEAGKFALLSRGLNYKMRVEADVSMLILTVHYKINLCKHFPLEMLDTINKTLQMDKGKIYPLKTNKILKCYLENLTATIATGLKCSYFHELKRQELFYYLRAYYPKKDLVGFFLPILNNDSKFAELVYQNYKLVENIPELAKITSYSISGFKKHFNKVFGSSPQQWIDKEKAKNIHYEILCTQKSFKEIWSEHNFYSASHFNAFCKRMFGSSPSGMRHDMGCTELEKK